MTREEASNILDDYDVNFDGHTAEEIAEAFEVAFRALEQEPCNIDTCKVVKAYMNEWDKTNNSDAISRQAVLDCFTATKLKKFDFILYAREEIKKLPSVNPQEPKWIPIKTRPLTDKEKEEYADLGYSEDSITIMYDCPLPEDGEEVLITTRYDEVTTDTFYRDEGCCFETYCDKDDVKAWMPLPKPYKAESEEV